MKYTRINLLICILIIGVLLTGCKEKEKEVSVQSIYISKKLDCNEDLELYYTDQDNIKYYSKCLSEIFLNINDKKIPLKDALDNNKEIIDQLLDKMTIVDVIMDGGTKIYKDFGYSEVAYSDLGNTALTIIKCNAINLDLNDINVTTKINNNYYFGDSSLIFEEDYCNN